ncbi:hypothetical protein PAXINDRAFT_18197 [Paxillus involutus ATCC 200175]|uniref:Unplaced genomic scaffold PAXINscaffold_254, whole genome shotgun sequence n=1 Tax=Paxillus involutus ATCC 200175 TaxID=664439 RepID=A0A0C9TN93_PAXIN|nr:hypothetical protein PAXINDRAFT_18197 [Paxillus involutus ATCC 200175]
MPSCWTWARYDSTTLCRNRIVHEFAFGDPMVIAFADLSKTTSNLFLNPAQTQSSSRDTCINFHTRQCGNDEGRNERLSKDTERDEVGMPTNGRASGWLRVTAVSVEKRSGRWNALRQEKGTETTIGSSPAIPSNIATPHQTFPIRVTEGDQTTQQPASRAFSQSYLCFLVEDQAYRFARESIQIPRASRSTVWYTCY